MNYQDLSILLLSLPFHSNKYHYTVYIEMKSKVKMSITIVLFIINFSKKLSESI